MAHACPQHCDSAVGSLESVMVLQMLLLLASSVTLCGRPLLRMCL